MTNSIVSKYIDSQRLRLHYRDWGNADAPPLLLVHGGFDHCRSWDWAAQLLSQKYRVITPDLRGHGDSSWALGNAYSMADYVVDMAELVDQLALAPVSIVGHSLGGAIALKYAGAFPDKVKELVAIEGLVPPQKMLEEDEAPPHERLARWVRQRQIAAKKTRRDYASLQQAINRMQEEHPHLSTDQVHHLTVHGCGENEEGNFSWKFDPAVRAYQPFDMTGQQSQQLWGKINCPVLLMCGADSWASNPLQDGRVDYFQQAQVVSFAKAGHWLHHDQLELFMAALEDFLMA